MDLLSRLRSVGVAAPADYSKDRSDACIDEVRAHLTTRPAYALSPRALLRIARKHGLDRFPDALLIDGLVNDNGPRGAKSSLRAALQGSKGRRDPHPLFATAYYMWTNPDVAQAGVAPWLHYQKSGFRESRSPHPLLDVDYIRQWAPHANRLTAIDQYLRDPAMWTIDTSPYVECQRYILAGGWTGSQPPLTDIVRSGAREPWVNAKLSAIDVGVSNSQSDASIAALYLLVSNEPRARFARIVTWSDDPSGDASLLKAPHSSGARSFTVVPGLFVGADGIAVWSEPTQAISADRSIIRYDGGFVGLEVGDSFSADELAVLRGALQRDDLLDITSRDPGRKIVVAPATRTQESALRILVTQAGARHVTVLPWGRQAHVEALTLSIAEGSSSRLPLWQWPECDPRDVVFVDAAPHGATCSADPDVREFVRRGASLLLIDPDDMERWAREYAGRAHVVATTATEEFVAAVFPSTLTTILETPRNRT